MLWCECLGCSNCMTRLADLWLELRIRYHYYAALYSDRSRFHWLMMAALIKRRSGRQVARMERNRGLG